MKEIVIPIKKYNLEGYNLFVKCKRLPKYKIKGSSVITDEISYNYVFNDKKMENLSFRSRKYLFDYQNWIIKKALENRNYAAFLDCGLGKTLIQLNWCKTVAKLGKVLLLCPLAVMEEFAKDNDKFVHAKIANLRNGEAWKSGIGIVNYESRKQIDMRGVIGICLDESSILKNGEGAIRKYLQDLQINCEYRLACSATPSPNEQAEYATHAVWLNQANTLNEYYARYFRKDGTSWFLKRHAEDAFYENLNTWACYIQDPEKLGFQRGGKLDHEPKYIEMHTSTKQDYLGGDSLIQTSVSMREFSKIAGTMRANVNESRFRNSINAIKNERAVVWCIRNNEQDAYKKHLENGAVIDGKTPISDRVEIINRFKRGDIQHIISKPKVLGFGVNIQEATAHLFSGYDFSFEKFYQAIRRSHRYGRKGRLKVYIPIADIEYPVYQLLFEKLKTFESDVKKLQERFVLK